MRSQSNKTVAEATGTLAIRSKLDDRDDVAIAFEYAIDDTKVLRRVGEVEVREVPPMVELRAKIAYGPVYGCFQSHIHRQLRAIVQRIGSKVVESGLLNFNRTFLTADEVSRVVRELTDTVN